MLKVCLASKITTQNQACKWLVEHIWSQQAVGIIGGEPKSCKSFLALSLGVAVASAKPFLNQFAVKTSGRVLFYPAEDDIQTVRDRLSGICQAQEIDFSTLPFFVITNPQLKLDIANDRTQLCQTIEKLNPTLLILDPFVRLHSIDENASGQVAEVLQHLRFIQRKYKLAIALVHHAKKSAANKRPGQALRGSSEFHAWGDSNLYLRRNTDHIELKTEHRAASAVEPISLQLTTCQNYAYLEIQAQKKETPSQETFTQKGLSPEQQIMSIITNASKPIKAYEIRKTLHLRNNTVSNLLARLIAQGMIANSRQGFTLVNAEQKQNIAPE